VSLFAKRRRRAQREAIATRTGESFSDSNGTLPRAQQRVFEAVEADALAWGDGGGAPIEGARLWAPGARAIAPPRAVLRQSRLKYGSLTSLSYRAPFKTLECARRGIRREVLFARRIAGRRRSPGRGGSYRRRPESLFAC